MTPVATAVLVFWTMAAATAAWAGAEWCRSARQEHLARPLWMAGAWLALVHAVAAYGVFYGFSQDAALTATEAQTAALTGVRSGSGLYLNYLFLLAWLVDGVWWMFAPARFARRPRAIDRSVRGFLFFMFVNGGFVFADGWMRVLGAAATLTVMLAWYREWRRSRGSA